MLRKKSFDSLLSVSKIQQFLWSKKENRCINFDRSLVKWPRTQDLSPLYEINHAFYINSRENYLKLHDRIGESPLLFELDRIHSFDIDWAVSYTHLVFRIGFFEHDSYFPFLSECFID